MTQHNHPKFASSAWWSQHPDTNPAVVHSILSICSEKRPPENIWAAPSPLEWRRVARLVAEYGDDDECGNDCGHFAWGLLWGLLQGVPPPLVAG